MTEFLLPAMSFAFAAVSIPGALQTYLLSVTLRYGFQRGAMVALSPLVSDGPIIVLMVFLLGALPEWVIPAIRLVGGAVLLWIAWGLFQQIESNAAFTADADMVDDDNSSLQILGKAAAINALNPGPWLFWSTVIGPLFIAGLDQSIWQGGAVLLGFYGTFIGALLLLVVFFDRLGRINPRMTQGIMIVALGLLVWFATDFIAQVLELVALHRQWMPFIIAVGYALLLWRYRQRFVTTGDHDNSPDHTSTAD